MKSIRLSFNTAVARDILRRCWPLWVAYLVFLAFTFPVNLVSYLQEAGPALSADPVGRYTSHVLSLSIIQAQVAIGVAILTVMVLFGWMYNSRGNTLMNLLPIPALDGGHIVFCLYEMLTGRKPSDKFLEVAQIIGMILLMLLMVLAFGNDIRRLFQ